MEKNKIEKGMVFTDRDDPRIEYVVLDVFPDKILLEQTTYRQKGSTNRHVSFIKPYMELRPVRIMDEEELYSYISDDPRVNLETGIYRMLVDLVDINMKDLAPKGSIINVLSIECKKIPASDRHEFFMEFQLFGVEDSRRALIVENTIEECMEYYWKMMKRIPV